MKNKRQKIQQFQLSPLAKAGIAIKNFQDEAREEEHDSSKPHRDHHYLLMVATHGRFQINLDFKEWTINVPGILLISPGQVHHIVELNEPQGWAISFDPSVMDNELQAIMEKCFRSPITLDRQTAFYQQAVTLMDLMDKLQSGGPSAHGIKAIRSLLDALLSLIAGELITQPASSGQTRTSRGAIIEQAFNQLLKQHYKSWKQPAQYAAELNISVAHLYDTVKEITGSSVASQIQQYAILEAKRLLYFTNLNVKEIGYELGYSEPVYFGKLFKKITGVTPLQFRQQYHD